MKTNVWDSMGVDHETFLADLLALEALAYDLYVNARFHMEEVRYWPVGSSERETRMYLSVYYQEAARRISNGVVWRRLALVEGNTI